VSNKKDFLIRAFASKKTKKDKILSVMDKILSFSVDKSGHRHRNEMEHQNYVKPISFMRSGIFIQLLDFLASLKLDYTGVIEAA
jgi:hypothetical protein